MRAGALQAGGFADYTRISTRITAEAADGVTAAHLHLPPGAFDPRLWLREAFARQRLLTGFAVLLWLAMLPALAFFLLMERRIVDGLTGAVKG